MKKNFLFIILLGTLDTFTINPHNFPASNNLNQALTYDLNTGRFGDHLISLLKCLRFGWDYDIPILYKSFKYSSEFNIHTLMPQVTEHQMKFKKKINFKDRSILQRHLQQSDTLFISSFYSLPVGTSAFSPELYLAMTEPAFKQFIDPLFASSKAFNTIPLPTDRITVAMHVRRGDYEGALASKKTFLDKVWPLKFPPNSFYINAIKYISELYNNAPLYVFIFTDFSKPQVIVDYYKKVINKPNILFECRHNAIGKDRFVLEDFFSILNFDCFIHSMSSYSQCATILGNFDVRIYPYTYHWENSHTMIIDTSVMLKNNEAFIIKL